MQEIAKTLSIAVLLLLLCGAGLAQEPEHIRVAVNQDAPTLRIKVPGYYEVSDAVGKGVLYQGRGLNTTAAPFPGGIMLGTMKPAGSRLIIKARDPDMVVIDGRSFRGDVQLIRKENGNLLAVNDIDFEDYIKGVLYHEASHYWPLEALKAQAVVCRSYAVSQAKQNAVRDFDATSDIYSQVYGGKTSERFRTNRAVEDTKNEVLTYQGEVLPAYFHATCAGHTEDASQLWNVDLLPLKGVACNFCKESPHFNWHYVFTKEEIKEKLNAAGYKIKKINDLRIVSRDLSERVTALIITSGLDEIKVSGKDFRNILGPNLIRSANFGVSAVNDDVVFEGFGWGHGVGLCQWGAYFMAKQGADYKQILSFYYPGAAVSKLK